MEKIIFKAKIGMSARPNYPHGIRKNTVLKVSYDDSQHPNYYKTVMERETWIAFVEGDCNVEVPVDIYKETREITLLKSSYKNNLSLL